MTPTQDPVRFPSIMDRLSKRLPDFVPPRRVVGRQENGSFVLQVDVSVLQRLVREGWTVQVAGPYATVTCPPPPVPDVPNHKVREVAVST